MIKYKTGLFGLKSLFVWNGSAVFRAFLPASLSNGVLLLYYFIYGEEAKSHTKFVDNTYTIAAYISIVGFLLVFRLNYSYQRYWESTTQIHRMSGRWLDSAICLASFHYQCREYDDRRPLSFGSLPKIKNETRERERRVAEKTIRKSIQNICAKDIAEKKTHSSWSFRRKDGSSRYMSQRSNSSIKSIKPNRRPTATLSSEQFKMMSLQRIEETKPNRNNWRASFAPGLLSKGKRARLLKLTGLESATPSLFLQEAAHLYSLLSAVAMSTLRSDVEGTMTPLTEYKPDLPLPAENPDELGQDIQMKYYKRNPLWGFVFYLFGLKRSRRERTLYNAARPFHVIGGISDEEARCLQQAKGPYAQMALCNMWLKEFISREYLNGSTGNVAPPIVARVYQFISIGAQGYTQCRKVAFVPFPFPHDQSTVFFTFLSLLLLPLLYVGYVNNLAFALVMNFTTVLCFVGTHEVARELSDPLHTYPNDLPLNNLHAQFNEALISMWAGFHPDARRVDNGDESDSFDDQSVSSASSMSDGVDMDILHFSKTVDITGRVKINANEGDDYGSC